MAFDTNENKLNRRQAVSLIGAGAIVLLTARNGRSSPPVSVSKASGDLYYMSLREVGRRIQSRLSPVDLTRLMLDRIAKVDPG